MKKILLALSIIPMLAVAGDGSLPIGAVDGECYRHEFTPPKYQTTTTTVIVKESYTYYDVTPAVFRTVQKEVAVGDPYEEHIEVPPVFEVGSIDVVTAGGKYWSLTQCAKDTELACYHDSSETSTIPVSRVIKEASYTTVQKPAVSKMVDYLELVSPSKVVEKTMPAETKEVAVTKVIDEGSMLWVKGQCDGDVGPVVYSSRVVKEIQTKLYDLGVFSGARDGILGPVTRRAIGVYRREQHISDDPKALIESLRL